MEALMSICLGLGLSAACGFRIFVPLLAMGVASRAGHLELGGDFQWIASDAALVALGIATACEIAAYYVPWVDNFLDTLATPTAVVAGILATAASVHGTSELLGWAIAVIGGGGVAGLVQAGTTVARGASSVMTAGLGNPLVSTLEAGGALTLSVLAILVPLAAATIVGSTLLVLGLRTARRKGRVVPDEGQTV